MDEVSARAASFACALLGDGHAAEREELISAGVSLRRVDLLYPLDFTNVEPALRAYLDGGSKLRSLTKDLSEELTEADEAYWVGLGMDNQLKALDVLDGIPLEHVSFIEYVTSHPNTTAERSVKGPANLQIEADLTLLWYALWHVLNPHAAALPVLERHLVAIVEALLPDLSVHSSDRKLYDPLARAVEAR